MPKSNSKDDSTIPIIWQIPGAAANPIILKYSANINPTPTGSIILVNPEKMKVSPNNILENPLKNLISTFFFNLF